MKAWEFEAVTYDGEIYCVECCPVRSAHADVFPIFADSEWEYYPVCCECGLEHDYVGRTQVPL